ncbi:MAG TPA: S1 RNA-binding domain-containing protein [Anaeromyxobacteraceae bacterium]
MADRRKPDSPGPVVIRKGVVELPPPAGTAEPAAPEPPAAANDSRPLWQRLADEKRGARAPGRSGPRQSRSPAGKGRGGARGERPGGAGAGAPRRPERGEEAGARPPPGDRPPALPPGEPPPAPEAPAAEEGSFADLLAGSAAAPRRRFQVGEKVAGKIIQLGQDVAFLELGSGVAEGMIEVVELQDEEGKVTAREGDIVDAVVIHATDRGVLVSKGRRQTGHAGREALLEAGRTGLPVEGVVKAVNKGGLEVEVLGQRAFCPMSQIDVRFVGDPAVFVGQRLAFKVQRADARDAVLSRRALLEEERAERARKTRQALAEGAVFDGAVTSVQDYGAFVDIGGLEGLVHVSELAWDRVSRPQELLKAGDQVKVQVLKLEEDARKGVRIALSVRSLVPRPEPEAKGAPAAEARVPPPPPRPGDVVEAAVDKVEPFGVFVRFAGGRGLVPAAETGTPRGADLRKAFRPGDALKCLVTDVDERGRIRLSMSQAEVAVERAEAQAWMARAAPPRGAGRGFGTLGDLLRDKLKK